MSAVSAMTLGVGMEQSFALDLLLILGCAGLVGVVFGRLRLAPIPGYLVAGLLLGVFVEPNETIGAVTQLATVLLLFTIGMHLDLASLRYGGTKMVIAGALSTLVSVGVLTPIGMAFGLSGPAAVSVGMALSLSSTAVVMRLLQQRRELRRPSGRMALGVLLMQDILVIGMLALVPTLAGFGDGGAAEGEATSPGPSLLALLGRVVALAALIGGSAVLLPRLSAIAARVSSEVLLVLSAAAGLSAAVVTAALGLSPELGAFAAGLVLAGTPLRFQIAGQLAPLRDLFMAVFFTAIGLSADVGVLGELWWVVLLGAAIVLVVKTLTIGISTWAAGSPAGTSARVGMALSQTGEFSIIVLVAGVSAGLLTGRQEGVLLGVTIVTLIATPALLQLSTRFGRVFLGLPTAPWWKLIARADAGTEAPSEDGGHLHQHVVIAGFGPVGRAVAERLESARVPYAILELNLSTVQTQRRLGRTAVYGDATNPDVLESAGVEDASAIVVTIPDDEAMLRACRTIRRMAPEACLVARAGTAASANLARLFGANEVIVDELAAAQSMSQRVVREFANRNIIVAPAKEPEPVG